MPRSKRCRGSDSIPMSKRIHVAVYGLLGTKSAITGFAFECPVASAIHMLVARMLGTKSAITGIAFKHILSTSLVLNLDKVNARVLECCDCEVACSCAD